MPQKNNSTADWLTDLVKDLVDHPAEVRVEQYPAGEYLVLVLDLAEQDKGSIIGKDGQMIDALRTLSKRASFQRGENVLVQIRRDGR